MTSCPVCEHEQEAGAECEVCGRRLGPGLGSGDEVARLEGLEPTRLDAEGGPGEVEPLPELEATRFEPVELAPLDGPVLELEATRAAPVEAPLETTPDLERHLDGLPEDGPTLRPLSLTCRYCRTEAQPGERRCARCGMRLPVVAEPSAPSGGAEEARRCSCGAPVTSARCPACGARHASA